MATTSNPVISALANDIHVLSRLIYRNKQQHKHASAFKGMQRVYRDVQLLRVPHLEKLHTQAETLLRTIQIDRYAMHILHKTTHICRRCTSEQVSTTIETLRAFHHLCDCTVVLLDRCISTSIELSQTIRATYFLPLYTLCLACVARISACCQKLLHSSFEQHRALAGKLRAVATLVPRHAHVINESLPAVELTARTTRFLEEVGVWEECDGTLGTTMDEFSNFDASVSEAVISQDLGDMITIKRIALKPSSAAEDGQNNTKDIDNTSESSSKTETSSRPRLAHEYSDSEESENEEKASTATSDVKKNLVPDVEKKKSTAQINSYISFFKQQQGSTSKKKKSQKNKPPTHNEAAASVETVTATQQQSTTKQPQKRKETNSSNPTKKRPKQAVDDIDAIFNMM